jgi:valyl-tRNA synthetase
MLGKTTLFVPGFDHGGISTEYVVEKRLQKLTGLDRYDIGREKLLHTIQAWNTE